MMPLHWRSCVSLVVISSIPTLCQYAVTNNKMIVVSELVRIWKEAVVTCFKALAEYLPREMYETSARIAGLLAKIRQGDS